MKMRMYVELARTSIPAYRFQGIDGPVEFSGTTPDLDDFTIRIVDGMVSKKLATLWVHVLFRS